MKNSRIIPLVILLLLIGLVAFSLVPWHSAAPKPTEQTAPATEIKPDKPEPVAAAPAPVAPQVITNPEPATTTTKAVAAPEKIQETPAPTVPETKPAPKIVEMPTTIPQAPTNFYTGDMATNHDYTLRFRAGYQHVNHSDNNDTFWLSVKFSASGDRLREHAGKNAWLVPDADAEFSHQDLAKKSGGVNAGSDEGVQLQASLFWPWMRWALQCCSRTNNTCPFSGPMALALGPTANVGFDQLFDGTSPQMFGHGGARLTLNRDAFVEYTFGGAENLGGTRQQLVGELPIFQSRNGQIRYVVRGLWDHTTGNHPDLLQGAFFVEMPFDFIATPFKWSDLIPFKK